MVPSLGSTFCFYCSSSWRTQPSLQDREAPPSTRLLRIKTSILLIVHSLSREELGSVFEDWSWCDLWAVINLWLIYEFLLYFKVM